MELKSHQIQRIIDTFIQEKSIGKTVKITKYPRNTVKKYLRMYGLIPDYYSSSTHTGPPSLYHQSSKWTPEQQQWIKELLNKVQLGYSQGANLIKALNKKNVENDELTEKITQINTEKEEEIQEKEKLQDKVSELENTNGEIKKEYQTNLEEQKNNYAKKITELEQKHQGDLEELTKNVGQYVKTLAHTHQQELQKEKTKVTERDEYIRTIEKEKQGLTDKLTTTQTQLSQLTKAHNETLKENDTQKQVIGSLQAKEKSSLGRDLFIGGVGAVAGAFGVVVYQKLSSPPVNAPRPLIVDSKYNHPRYTVDPILEIVAIQPEEQNINSGIPPDINTAGAFNCSGAYPTTDGSNTGVEHTRSLNQQNDKIPDYHESSGDVTISTNISGTIQASEPVMIHHIETMNIPQTPSSHYVPPPQISQVYFFPQATPVPPELIGPFGWIPIQQMDWTQSTPFICWGFQQLGYTIISVKKSHDKGADILLERFGEILVIQVKHQQANTGIDALKDVLFGKTMYDATRMIVISFASIFTKDALKDAEKAGIELWDLDRVIEELRRYNIYYPID